MTGDVRSGGGARWVPTIGVMLGRLQRWSTRRRVVDLIRGGVGVSERSWTLGAGGAPVDFASEIAAWAREEMAGMRRPGGIDQVVMALACRDGAGRVVCSASLGVVRPGAFYDGTAEAELTDALAAARAVAGEDGEVLVALVRLGDLAYRLQGGRAAA